MRKRKPNILFRVLFFINIIVSILLMVSYLSSYLNPDVFWYIGVLGLGYLVLLLINILFLIFWAIFQKKYLLLSLFAIILGWRHVGEHLAFNHQKEGEASLTIMSYNAQRLLRNKIYKNNSKMWDMMNEQHPDIICFQEFFLKKDFTQLKEKYPTLKSHSFLTSKYYNGIFTFSKFPSIRHGQLKYKDYFSVFDDLIIHGDTIRLYNIQLNSNGFGKEKDVFDKPAQLDEEKSKQVKSLLKKLRDAYKVRVKEVDMLRKHIKKCPYPVILCGDFNDTPLSYSYQQLNGGLSDAFMEVGSGIGNTHNENLPPIRIDYILYPKFYTALDFKTIKVNFSDHFPIIAYLKKEKNY